MTTKFLVASLLGVSGLGGAIASGVYLFKDNAPPKTEKSAKEIAEQSSTQKVKDSAPAKPDAPETLPQAKAISGPAGAANPGASENTQSQQTAQREVSSSEGTKLTK